MVNSPRLREAELPRMSKCSALPPTFSACAPRTKEKSSETWFVFWKKLRGVLRSVPKRLYPLMEMSPTSSPGMKARPVKPSGGVGSSTGVVRLKA